MIQIDLPFPPSVLHPNARVHWSKKARATKTARHAAQWMACGYGPIEAERLDVAITFFPPDKRRRDIDGMLSACKALIDGVSDALEVDDSRWNISLRRGDVVKHGLVRFEIEVAQ